MTTQRAFVNSVDQDQTAQNLILLDYSGFKKFLVDPN